MSFVTALHQMSSLKITLAISEPPTAQDTFEYKGDSKNVHTSLVPKYLQQGTCSRMKRRDSNSVKNQICMETSFSYQNCEQGSISQMAVDRLTIKTFLKKLIS